MHPAYSVIVFTTATGAGYGLLIWLSAGVALGLVPRSPVLGFVGLGLALALITTGLLSSTLHLGRPERAWRALSQWRSSWLSREGVAALAAYLPAGALGLGWVFGELWPGQVVVAAWLAVVMCLVTLWCTGMIYASLTTIRSWNHPLVAPLYVVLALATGGVLLTCVLTAFGHETHWALVVTTIALMVGWLLKGRYWYTADRTDRIHTAEAATGLGPFGIVRPLDPPHTQPNFVMREMGYQIARQHSDRLRRLSMFLLFVLPLLLVLAQFATMPRFAQVILAVVAVLSASAGVLVERWLFFAQAQHVVTLYYHGGKA